MKFSYAKIVLASLVTALPLLVGGCSESGSTEVARLGSGNIPSSQVVAADPVPVAVEAPCKLIIDLQGELPDGLSAELRVYDRDKQLRYIDQDVVDLSAPIEIDRSSSVVACILKKADGELYGFFKESLADLADEVSITPNIVSGAGLLARSELVVNTDKPIYNLDEEEPIYVEEKQDEHGQVVRFVKVYCEANVVTDIIEGTWSYQTPSSFLRDLCIFDADDADVDDRGVFRFFGVGEHSITVYYEDLSATFKVVVTDNSAMSPNTVTLNLSSLPANTSRIITQFYKGTTPDGDEIINDSGTSFAFEDMSTDVDYVVSMVKDSSGHLVGLASGNVIYDSHNVAVVNLNVASGSAINNYVDSLEVSPVRVKLGLNSTLNGQATAALSFKNGSIKKTVDLSEGVFWSSSTMTQINANCWKVTQAGPSTLMATLGTKTASTQVFASGTSEDAKYGYSELQLNGKTIVVEAYTPEKTGNGLEFYYDGSTVIDEYPCYRYADGVVHADAYGDTSGSVNAHRDSLLRSVSNDNDSEVEHRCGLSLRKNVPFLDSGSESPTERNGVRRDVSELTPGQQYKDCVPGQTIYNLKAISFTNSIRNINAQVMIGDAGNEEGVSNRVIVLAELRNNGEPVISYQQAKELDRLVGISNDLDPDGLAVLDRIRNTFGTEAGFGKDLVMSEACKARGLYPNGFDNTDKLIILILDPSTMMSGSSIIGGYYYTVNPMPRSLSSISNEGEVIAINPYYILDKNAYGNVIDTIGHEFQHLIEHHNLVIRDYDIFIKYFNGEINASNFYRQLNYRTQCHNSAINFDEGFSALAQILVGAGVDDKQVGETKYIASSFINKANGFIDNASTVNFKTDFSLSNDVIYGINKTYGKVLVFSGYLYDRYGLDLIHEYFNVFNEAVDNNEIAEETFTDNDKNGTSHTSTFVDLDKNFDFIARAVSNLNGTDLNFGEVYRDFGTSLLLSKVNSSGVSVYKNVPEKYRLRTIVPGSRHTVNGYTRQVSSVIPQSIEGAYTANNLVPWSLNYYETSNNADNNIFGFWAGVDSIFSLILLSKDGQDWQYVGLE